MDVSTYVFPTSSNDSTTGDRASVDYGRFVAFLEREDGKIACLRQGEPLHYN